MAERVDPPLTTVFAVVFFFNTCFYDMICVFCAKLFFFFDYKFSFFPKPYFTPFSY